jgi:cysteine desulfurase family protein (TIGR01976 family)
MFDDRLVSHCRSQFPALTRSVQDRPAVFFDGPAGTQVPQRVIDAISQYLATMNANHGGLFPTAMESDQLLDEAHRTYADLLGAEDPQCVYFGQNMTSLTFALSRALARTWRAGDEIVVTRLDHDANVTPWVLAARDAGATVRWIDIRPEDCTLDLEQLRSCLNSRTKLVAVGCASNSVGTINPVKQIAEWAHEVGALAFLDAVHFAPHARIDVKELGCDFLACSAYKFFGPHTGIIWGRRELLEKLEPYKVRPATNELPGKWMTGTQSHESIAGCLAAVEYLADIGRTLEDQPEFSRRAALSSAYRAIGIYERQLLVRLLSGLAKLPEVTVFGITDFDRLDERVSTAALTHRRFHSADLAERLGREGVFAWHGNYYALNLSKQLGQEPHGMLRTGLVHYNTAEEVDRLLQLLSNL